MNRAARIVIALFLLALANISSSHALAQTTAAPKYLTFAFTNNDHGWSGGSDGIDVTADGGRSWHAQYRGRRVDQLVIIRRRIVYALAAGAVLRTENDGALWSIVAEPQLALKRIALLSDRDAFGIGADNVLYQSRDGAKTWRRASFARPVNAVCFSDRRTGFVGGAVTAPALGAFDGIAATTDGGRTWADATRPPSAGLVGIAGHSLHCTRDSVYDLADLGAHAGGSAYVFARSTDIARSWKPVVTGGQAPRIAHVPQGPGSEATSASAYSARAAYVAGFCGACGPAGQSAFGATTDAGATWQNATLGALGFTSAPVFTTPEHGWIGARVIVKDHPAIDEVLVTDDAGRNWKPIFTAP